MGRKKKINIETIKVGLGHTCNLGNWEFLRISTEFTATLSKGTKVADLQEIIRNIIRKINDNVFDNIVGGLALKIVEIPEDVVITNIMVHIGETKATGNMESFRIDNSLDAGIYKGQDVMEVHGELVNAVRKLNERDFNAILVK